MTPRRRRRPRPLPKLAGVCGAAISVVLLLAEPEVKTLAAQLLDFFGIAEYGPLAAKFLGICATIAVLLSHSLTGRGKRGHAIASIALDGTLRRQRTARLARAQDEQRRADAVEEDGGLRP